MRVFLLSVLATLVVLQGTYAQSTGGSLTGTNSGGSGGGTTALSDYDKIKQLYDDAKVHTYIVGGVLGGVILIISIILLLCVLDARKKLAAKLEKDSWAQNMLDSKTIPLGAINPSQVLTALQVTETSNGLSTGTQALVNGTIMTLAQQGANATVNSTVMTTAVADAAPVNSALTTVSIAGDNSV